MTLKKETLANSELVYHLIKELLDGEKTPTELSEGLDTSSQSVNNYLKRLRELGVVQKVEKKGRKQPYAINRRMTKNFIYKLFLNYIDSILDDKETQEIFESYKAMNDIWNDYTSTEALNNDLDVLMFEFVDVYFTTHSSSTINDMFEGFLDGIEMVNLENEDIGWLYSLQRLAKARHDYVRDPELLMNTAIENYKNYPDTIEKRNTFLLDVYNEDYLKEVDTEPVRKCPNCGYTFSKDRKISIDGENICPNCEEEFEMPDNSMKVSCPVCGDSIKDPQHGKEVDCGCGKLVNRAEMELNTEENLSN